MPKLKSILVPVDISEPEVASPALERAVDLAHFMGGSIHLIYVPVSYNEFLPPD